MNTRLRTRNFVLAAALPLFAAPVLSHAESATAKADATLDACVKAFVSTNFEKERPYSVVTTDTNHFDPQAAAYRISLTATGKQSGKKLAKATCVVDRSGVTLTTDGKSAPVLTKSVVLSSR
jgi:hypothetical protein